MNAEAEAEIARLKMTVSEDEVRLEFDNLIRAAMAWVYQDAARICDSLAEAHHERGGYLCAEAIEQRAK